MRWLLIIPLSASCHVAGSQTVWNVPDPQGYQYVALHSTVISLSLLADFSTLTL